MKSIFFTDNVLKDDVSIFSKTFLVKKYSRSSFSSAKRSTDFWENSSIVKKLLKNF